MITIYQDPISTTSRPLLLFLAEHELEVELVQISLLAREQLSDDFRRINPNRAVPALVDGDLMIGEHSAILKYLADVASSAAYPAGAKARAWVNARMDWLNTGFSKDLGGHVYPQVFPNHAHPDPLVHQAIIRMHGDRAARWLTILNRDMLGDGRLHLGGREPDLSDYMAAVQLGFAEAAGFDLTPYANIDAYLRRMKARPAWGEVHAAFYGLIAAIHEIRHADRFDERLAAAPPFRSLREGRA
jgi:glutathione S-transferase